MSFTVGSLFSGIGGLDLGLERAGMTVRWQVENDAYCQRVLAKHWPDVPRYGDIKELDPHDLEPVDLICGGFPCQPVSLAGRGRAQEDERWLWPDYARIVRGVRPRFVLVENVPGLLVRGMGDVLGDLAELGYDTEWASIPASAVGAPHLRWRVFLVAYTRGEQHEGDSSAERRKTPSQLLVADSKRGRLLDSVDHLAGGSGAPASPGEPLGQSENQQRVTGEGGHVADPASQGSPNGRTTPHRDSPTTQSERRDRSMADADAERWIGRPWLFGTGRGREPSDGGEWATEPDVGRVAHGVPSRVDRLRGLGNAVVPQVAEYVGRRITGAAS